MSRTDRPVLELPAVPSDADVSVDALTLELTLEPASGAVNGDEETT